MQNTALQIISILFQLVLVPLLMTYLLYYIRQKVKNQVDKEDLKDLTKIVEDVRIKYIQENEILKANLILLTNKQNEIFNESKNAIIEFYSELNKWLWGNLNLHTKEYNETNYFGLSDKILSLREQYNLTNIAFGKVQLLVHNNDIVSSGHEAIMNILELHNFVENTLEKLKTKLLYQKLTSDQIFSKEILFEKLSEEMLSHYYQKIKKIEEEIELIQQNIHEKHNELFSKAMSKRNIYRDFVIKYLKI